MAKLIKGLNDLETTHPDLAKEWHPTKNGNLKPCDITSGSGKKVWWYLPYDDPKTGKHFDFEWQSVICSRASGIGCPYLCGKAIWIGFNDLTTTHPDLAKEWHPIKNGNLNPCDVISGSRKKVWWYLPYDDPKTGKHFDFEWQAAINDRVNGYGCPFLSGHAVWKGFNDLGTVYPEIAKEWHPTKNGNITPEMVTKGYDPKVWWIYHYDVPNDYPIESLRSKHFDFEWQDNVYHRTKDKRGCPFIAGYRIWKGFNDLETTHPEIAKEWHPTKNGSLKPCDVGAGSHQKVWWIYHYDVPKDYSVESLRGEHFDFEWQASIRARSNMGNGCPFLSSQALWKGFNDLETTNPELAKEWHPTKNGNLKPCDVMAGTNRKAWWQYKRENPETGESEIFEWEALIINRGLNGYGCPYILNSKGEKAIRKILTNNNIIFKEQNTFPDRISPVGSRQLRDDFAIFDKYDKVIATIEFNGRQHYEPVDFAGKGQVWADEQFRLTKARDKVKADYLKAHNIPQLVISHKDFDDTEKIVNNFIKDLSKTHDLFNPQKGTYEGKSSEHTLNSTNEIDISAKDENIPVWTPPKQASVSHKQVKDFIGNILNSNKKDNMQQTSKQKEITTEILENLDINI